MPNTDPVNDHPGITELILRKAAEANLARVYPDRRGLDGVARRADVGARRSEGRRLRRVHRRWAAGGERAADAPGARIRRACWACRSSNHCEDPSLKGDGVAHEGFYAARLGLRGIPGVAESIMVERDIALAELTGGLVPRLSHERAPVPPRGSRRQGARGRPTSPARSRRIIS